MPMFAGADYYTRRDDTQPNADPEVLRDLSLEKLDSIVNKSELSNADLHAEAIRKADSYSFQVAHPELCRTAENVRLINHWLTSHGITNPVYADFDAAFQALSADGLLSIDKAKLARVPDSSPRTFRGALSGETFDSIDSLIAMERQVAIQQMRPEPTAEETAFDELPAAQALALLREAEKLQQRKAQAADVQTNGDAWITISPWYADNQRNAHLMKMQLAANGFSEDTATIEQFEICGRQLRESGLLTLNKAAVAKEHVAEVAQRAADATKQPGSVFDSTSEDEMYNLDLDEVRRRANVVMGR